MKWGVPYIYRKYAQKSKQKILVGIYRKNSRKTKLSATKTIYEGHNPDIFHF